MSAGAIGSWVDLNSYIAVNCTDAESNLCKSIEAGFKERGDQIIGALVSTKRNEPLTDGDRLGINLLLDTLDSSSTSIKNALGRPMAFAGPLGDLFSHLDEIVMRAISYCAPSAIKHDSNGGFIEDFMELLEFMPLLQPAKKQDASEHQLNKRNERQP